MAELKVLIVDDEQINIELLMETMEVIGCENTSATTSPVEAIKRYENESFDLVLLDLNMPEMSGYDVLDRLLKIEKPAKAKIVILTGHNDESIKKRVLDQGAAGMLSKPFGMNEIVDCIKHSMTSI